MFQVCVGYSSSGSDQISQIQFLSNVASSGVALWTIASVNGHNVLLFIWQTVINIITKIVHIYLARRVTSEQMLICKVILFVCTSVCATKDRVGGRNHHQSRAETPTHTIHTAHAHTSAVAHGWRAILCLLAYLDDSGIAEAAVIKGTTMETVMMIGIPLHATGKEEGRKGKREKR